MRRHVKAIIEIVAVIDNQPRFNLTCSDCGSFEQTRRGDGSIMDMVHCSGCGAWHGRLSALTAHAIGQAHMEGFEIDKNSAIYEIQKRASLRQGPTQA
jgi:hypothetical protein